MTAAKTIAGFTEAQKELLGRDLDDKRVKTRAGRGDKTFDYLEVWDVEDRANQIFGFDGWSCETVELHETWSGERPTRNGSQCAIVFRARVRVTVYAGERAIVKEAWGYGDGSGRDIGEASELAIKEAESDAEKRAFKKFGWQFGLALYDKSQEHVRAGVDDEPLSTEAERASSPPPPPPPPPRQTVDNNDEPGADSMRERAAAGPTKEERAARLDPGAPKVKAFEPPRIPDGASKARTGQLWREWSQQIAAAVRAAPDENNARAMLRANIKSLKSMGEAGGIDAIAWATTLIEKRWPPQEETAGEAPDGGDGFEVIPAPDKNTIDAWDTWLDAVRGAIESAPDEQAARWRIDAHKSEFDRASSVLELDVAVWADNKVKGKFKRAGAKKGGR